MELRKLGLAPLAAAMLAFGTPAIANNALTFQDVTFQTAAVDSDTMSFTILNALNATGDWADINYIAAFQFKDIGNVTGGTVTPSGFTFSDFELNANGCAGGDSGAACFKGTPVALTNSMSWTIDFVGTNLNFDSPHLKVNFYETAGQDKATGSLLSLNLPAVNAVPEPETYAMLLAGLGLMGFVARRRQRNLAAA
jgi:hypothetical protein